MATKNNNYKAIADGVRNLSAQTAPLMKAFAAQSAARNTRLTTVRDRLTQSLGAKNSRVIALAKSVESSGKLATNLASMSDRIARRPTVATTDLAAFGRVLGAKGEAISKAFVRISDKAGDAQISTPVPVDASGDYSLVLKACEVPEAKAALYLIVEDPNGKRLAVSKEPVTLSAGRINYQEIALSKQVTHALEEGDHTATAES